MRLRGTFRTGLLAGCALVMLAMAFGVVAADRAAVYPDVLSALRDSGMDLDRVVKVEPMRYDVRQQVAVYRFSGEGQRNRWARVASTVDPTAAPVEAPLTDAQRAYDEAVTKDLQQSGAIGNLKGIIIGHTASGRCDLRLYDGTYKSVEIFRTNLDFNNLREVSSSVNDRASSLETFCSPVMVYQHKQWTGASLYVPANTVINDLSANGMNNLISSNFIVCD